METKIPKPSGIKHPLPVTKPVVPMERIKAGSMSSSSLLFCRSAKVTQSTEINCNNSMALNKFPLNGTNLMNMKNIKERAASPDLARSKPMQTRNKLRRSRSVSDLRDMNILKRHEPTLAPIPAKTKCMMSTSTNAYASSTGALGNRPPRIGAAKPHTTIATKRTTTQVSKPIITKPPNASTSSILTNKKSNSKGSSETSVATTGPGKTINKRIPPYDYKARYNDLLEKYQSLKQKYQVKSDQMENYENLPEQLESTQAQLARTSEDLKNAQIENESLRRQVQSQQQKIDLVAQSLCKTTEELTKVKGDYNEIQHAYDKLSTEVLELRERTTVLTEQNIELTESATICKEQLFRSNMERKELHNTVMDLRGNIRVFCRVRPPLEAEQEKMLCGWSYIDEATMEIISNDPLTKNKNNAHCFSFDQVFHPGSRQEDIFELVSPLIQSALDGYNVCIFAYGQTGSGKTYTMDGTEDNWGVIPRTVDLLFDAIKGYRNLGWNYEIRVQFLEIYNEVLYDLLSNEAKEMEIRMVKNSKNDIYVTNITQEMVDNADRLRQLMNFAKMNRATAATAGNERSSRSHAVTKIELIGTHAHKRETSIGSINLVDLAGSESPKTSIRMNETKNINRSLSELTNVIIALLQKQDHIPYRNSKLTYLLMPSLGGNSKTLMFINVAPFQDCFQESLKSLRFAASVNQCKMSKVRRNRVVNNAAANSSGSVSNLFEK